MRRRNMDLAKWANQGPSLTDYSKSLAVSKSDEFDADVARQRTNEVNQAASDVDNSAQIITSIKLAAKQGRSSVYVADDLMTPMTKSKLEGLKFDVRQEPVYDTDDGEYPRYPRYPGYPGGRRRFPRVTHRYIVSW